MNDLCLTCEGLIVAPNIAYGYSGKVCRCYGGPSFRKRSSNEQIKCTDPNCPLIPSHTRNVCREAIAKMGFKNKDSSFNP